MNHFDLFNLPIGFALDQGLLVERYRAAVRALGAETSLSREADDDRACAITLDQFGEAYRTLLDPLSRARYLCSLYCVDAPLEDASAPSGASLIERIELEETLAAATKRSDPEAAVAKVLTQLAERSAVLDKELHSLFADPSPENVSAARDVVRQIQLLWRYRRDAEDWRAALGIRD